MTSEDVLHDFFIPDMRVKRDIVPGRYTEYLVHARDRWQAHFHLRRILRQGPLRYAGQGLRRHPRRLQSGWKPAATNGCITRLKNGAAPLREKGCQTCHTVDGTRSKCPTLERHLRQARQAEQRNQRHGRRNLHARIHDAAQRKVVDGFENIMPTFQGLLREE